MSEYICQKECKIECQRECLKKGALSCLRCGLLVARMASDVLISPQVETLRNSSALRNSAQRLVLPLLIDEPQTQIHPLRRKWEFYVRILCQITKNVCQIECQMQCENICQNIIARQRSDETPESIIVGNTRSVQYLDGHRVQEVMQASFMHHHQRQVYRDLEFLNHLESIIC